MFNTTNGMSPADFAAMTNNGTFGNDGMIFWWLIIIIALFNGNGFGYGNGGANENYVLASDFATLQRQIDSTSTTTQNMIGTSADALQRQVTSIGNGISSLGYDQLNQINGVNNNIFNSTNQLSTQMANGFCTNRYECLQNANTTQNMIQNGFCNTNFNMQSATRDITENTNAGIQAILAKLNEQELNAKQAQINDLTQKVNALNLAASQQAQNAYLVNQLGAKAPVPAYIVASPYSSPAPCCGCNA